MFILQISHAKQSEAAPRDTPDGTWIAVGVVGGQKVGQSCRDSPLGSPDRKGWPQGNSGRVSEVKSWHTAENDTASSDWGLNTEVQCGGRVRLKRERRS